MASIGLAMVQGEKNAQDLALGQMNTIAGMSRAATEAETQAQYFRPGAVALRNLTDSESQQAAKNIIDNRELIKGLSVDPETYAPQILEKTMGKSSADSSWVLEPMDTSGNYRAVEYSSDATKGQGGVLRSIPLGNKSQVAGVLAQNLTATSLDQLKQIAAMKSAADASDIKRREKLEDYIGRYMYELAPAYASADRRQLIAANAAVTSAGIQANSHIKGKLVELMDSGKDRRENALLKLRGEGFEIGDVGEPVKFQGMDIPSLPPAQAQAVMDKFNDTLNMSGQASAVGLPSITPTATVRKAGAARMPAASTTKAEVKVAPSAAAPTRAAGLTGPATGRDALNLLLGTGRGLQLRQVEPVRQRSVDEILGITR